VRALGIVAIAFVLACNASKIARTAAKDFFDCTAAELAQRVGAVMPVVEPAVKAAFAGAHPDLEPLKALGKASARDVVGCAIASAGAALAKALELAPKTFAQEVSPTAVRLGVREVALAAFAGARFRTQDGDL
jgi:hypothetical protein